MNGILGMAQLLAETPLSEEQAEYVSTIQSSATSLLLIINDILDLSKIEAEKLELLRKPFRLSELLRVRLFMSFLMFTDTFGCNLAAF